MSANFKIYDGFELHSINLSHQFAGIMFSVYIEKTASLSLFLFLISKSSNKPC